MVYMYILADVADATDMMADATVIVMTEDAVAATMRVAAVAIKIS